MKINEIKKKAISWEVNILINLFITAIVEFINLFAKGKCRLLNAAAVLYENTPILKIHSNVVISTLPCAHINST